MNILAYTLLAYGMTAVISFGVVAVIVTVNRIFAAPGKEADDADRKSVV